MKCPVCGSIGFYVKHPDDEYETCSFEIKNGEICFTKDDEEHPEVGADSRLYCERCAWNDKLNMLKK